MSKPEITLQKRKGLFVKLSPEALEFLKSAAEASGMPESHIVESGLRMLASRKLTAATKRKANNG
jgi:hypothetical protein